MGEEVELVQGSLGEFTVWVDGRKVASKKLLFFPSLKKILRAIRQALEGESADIGGRAEREN